MAYGHEQNEKKIEHGWGVSNRNIMSYPQRAIVLLFLETTIPDENTGLVK